MARSVLTPSVSPEVALPLSNLIAGLFLSTAQAADEPGLWFRGAVGTGGWPTGLMSDARLQYRTPLMRQEGSLVLNETYAGAGAVLRVTPAFSEAGVMLSLAPVDVFDLDLYATRTQWYSGEYGLMGFDAPVNRTDRDRGERAENGDGIRSGGWSLTAVPTAKMKLGPVIAFSSWTVSFLDIERPEGETAPFTYEPWRDQVLAWNDIAGEHYGAVLFEGLPGGERPLLLAGGVVRHRFSVRSNDEALGFGPLLVAQPVPKPAVPRIVAQAIFHAIEVDRVGGPPNLQMAAIWIVD